ncbi:aspartyl/asparaginyl beta-hydroxylase domain-containing protein [Thalassotalea sp. M1531]|uniref:Aspartyl/asparaginyl beta-hydroxylase domain-containing protein n=1 Tax=Thalassotalea algicola TaxID=2716224 RepID=A0A7Y0LFH7_9GAMM|nr:aspartyl/asparaginyl beta-hydroxylase domain-containing protein [Thalassotalea algicola]NMP33368.1 aspartyl/asparaginyl beta-hydroxylase domain-containing protein [Thalassotalea algicola]
MNTLERIDVLFKQQQNKEAFSLLLKYVEEHPKDQQQAYRLAIVSEQIGTIEQTQQAYLNCLKVCPNNALAYLYAGTFFLAINFEDKGLAILVVGEQLDSKITTLYRYENVEMQTRERSYKADMALRNFYTSQHQNQVGNAQSLQNVAQAIWPQTHNANFQYHVEHQRPHLFYLPHLTAKPFWQECSAFDVAGIESNLAELKNEFLALVDHIDDYGEPYLGDEYKQLGFDKLAGSTNWTALHIYKGGQLNELLADKLPVTLSTLRQLPLYKLNDNPFEVFYSVLKGGQHITPHYGLSNHSLTVHFPLIVPGEGYIKVADEQVQWQEGEIVAFDDSYIHEAVNHSEQMRVVLIFSVWHPELTLDEQAAIRRSFSARKEWQKNQKNYVDNLL